MLLCSAAPDKGLAGCAWWDRHVAQTQMGSGLVRRSLKHRVVAPHSCSSPWAQDHQAVLGARLCGGWAVHPGRGCTPSRPGKGPFPKNLSLCPRRLVTPRAKAASVSGPMAGQGGSVPVSPDHLPGSVSSLAGASLQFPTRALLWLSPHNPRPPEGREQAGAALTAAQ